MIQHHSKRDTLHSVLICLFPALQRTLRQSRHNYVHIVAVQISRTAILSQVLHRRTLSPPQHHILSFWNQSRGQSQEPWYKPLSRSICSKTCESPLPQWHQQELNSFLESWAFGNKAREWVQPEDTKHGRFTWLSTMSTNSVKVVRGGILSFMTSTPMLNAGGPKSPVPNAMAMTPSSWVTLKANGGSTPGVF